MNTCPKCRTALIPFAGYENTPCGCTAARMNTVPEFCAIKGAIQREALSDTDANLGRKYNRDPHRIYVIRKRMGIGKYCSDVYVRPSHA